MALLAMDSCCCITTAEKSFISSTFVSSKIAGRKIKGPKDFVGLKSPNSYSGFLGRTRASVIRNSARKLRRQKEQRKIVTPRLNKIGSDKYDALGNASMPGDDLIQNRNEMSSFDNLESQTTTALPSRSDVLQACTTTSGLIAALGVLIRQVSHIASVEGLPVIDCSTEVSFSFEMWHLQLITGLVILISSCRYVLLTSWPDFAESSEAANQQVLTQLQPLDYLVVAFLPGFSEELLFRGAVLPLFGNNWASALVVAALFGVLHLGSGRKYSFAIWATFVGFAYGSATIASSSTIVPMVTHAINNLVGGVMWKYTAKSSK